MTHDIDSIRKQIATLTAALDALEGKNKAPFTASNPAYLDVDFEFFYAANDTDKASGIGATFSGTLHVPLNDIDHSVCYDPGVDEITINDYDKGYFLDKAKEAIFDAGFVHSMGFFDEHEFDHYSVEPAAVDSLGRRVNW